MFEMMRGGVFDMRAERVQSICAVVVILVMLALLIVMAIRLSRKPSVKISGDALFVMKVEDGKNEYA